MERRVPSSTYAPTLFTTPCLISTPVRPWPVPLNVNTATSKVHFQQPAPRELPISAHVYPIQPDDQSILQHTLICFQPHTPLVSLPLKRMPDDALARYNYDIVHRVGEIRDMWNQSIEEGLRAGCPGMTASLFWHARRRVAEAFHWLDELNYYRHTFDQYESPPAPNRALDPSFMKVPWRFPWVFLHGVRMTVPFPMVPVYAQSSSPLPLPNPENTWPTGLLREDIRGVTSRDLYWSCRQYWDIDPMLPPRGYHSTRHLGGASYLPIGLKMENMGLWVFMIPRVLAMRIPPSLIPKIALKWKCRIWWESEKEPDGGMRSDTISVHVVAKRGRGGMVYFEHVALLRRAERGEFGGLVEVDGERKGYGEATREHGKRAYVEHASSSETVEFVALPMPIDVLLDIAAAQNDEEDANELSGESSNQPFGADGAFAVSTLENIHGQKRKSNIEDKGGEDKGSWAGWRVAD